MTIDNVLITFAPHRSADDIFFHATEVINPPVRLAHRFSYLLLSSVVLCGHVFSGQ